MIVLWRSNLENTSKILSMNTRLSYKGKLLILSCLASLNSNRLMTGECNLLLLFISSLYLLKLSSFLAYSGKTCCDETALSYFRNRGRWLRRHKPSLEPPWGREPSVGREAKAPSDPKRHRDEWICSEVWIYLKRFLLEFNFACISFMHL